MTERDEREGAQVGLVVEMRAAELQSWRDVMELVRPMPWLKRVWEEERMLLGEDVMSKLHISETPICDSGIS